MEPTIYFYIILLLDKNTIDQKELVLALDIYTNARLRRKRHSNRQKDYTNIPVSDIMKLYSVKVYKIQENEVVNSLDIFMIISMLGGLAMFLYGMTLLGSGLENLRRPFGTNA